MIIVKGTSLSIRIQLKNIIIAVSFRKSNNRKFSPQFLSDGKNNNFFSSRSIKNVIPLDSKLSMTIFAIAVNDFIWPKLSHNYADVISLSCWRYVFQFPFISWRKSISFSRKVLIHIKYSNSSLNGHSTILIVIHSFVLSSL